MENEHATQKGGLPPLANPYNKSNLFHAAYPCLEEIMPHWADLYLDFAPARDKLVLRLMDQQAQLLHKHELQLATLAHSATMLLHSPERYFYYYVPNEQVHAELVRLSTLLAQSVLGETIWRFLSEEHCPHLLRVHLEHSPSMPDEQVLKWACLPWGLACIPGQNRNLSQRHLHSIVHVPQRESGTRRNPNMPLRILMVSADHGQGARLNLRREQEQFQRLFKEGISPHRQIELHMLSHGVTRKRLQIQLEENGGYDLVHWHGNADHDGLYLSTSDGEADILDCAALLHLFRQAGTDLPHFWWLSNSNDSRPATQNWDEFFSTKEWQATPPALSGHAMPLLAWQLVQAGVTGVLAMRHASSTTYAHDLALAFYRRLWTDQQAPDPAQVLTLAQQELLGNPLYSPFDHLAPCLFCAEGLDLSALPGNQPAVEEPETCLPHLKELTYCPHFSGRVRELAHLGRNWLQGNCAVAQITGLGGMGKSSIVCEVLALWKQKFDWIIMFQAKEQALSLEQILAEIHFRLLLVNGVYAKHLNQFAADAIYRHATEIFYGEVRLARLHQNLLRAMQDEAILLVFDNFETCLQDKPAFTDAHGQYWRCADEDLESTLSKLTAELPDTRSRVLFTSRRPLNALSNQASTTINCVLAALSIDEARIWVHAHPALARLAQGDANMRTLLQRILSSGRLHPLLTERMALMSQSAEHAERLTHLLTLLEQKLCELPDLFATTSTPEELNYLEQALCASIRQLIDNLPSPARKLLWMVALAGEAIEVEFLQDIWMGRLITGDPDQIQSKILAQGHILQQLPLATASATFFDLLYLAPLKSYVKNESPFPLTQLIGLGLLNHLPQSGGMVYCHDYISSEILAWATQHETWDAENMEHMITARIVAGGAAFLIGTGMSGIQLSVRALGWIFRTRQYSFLLATLSPLMFLPEGYLRQRLIPELISRVQECERDDHLIVLHVLCHLHFRIDELEAADIYATKLASLLPEYQEKYFYTDLVCSNYLARIEIANLRRDFLQAESLLKKMPLFNSPLHKYITNTLKLRIEYYDNKNKSDLLKKITSEELPALQHAWQITVQKFETEAWLELHAIFNNMHSLTELLFDSEIPKATQLYWVELLQEMSDFLHGTFDSGVPLLSKKCSLLKELGRHEEALALLEKLQAPLEKNGVHLQWLHEQRLFNFLGQKELDLALQEAKLIRLLVLQDKDYTQWAKWNYVCALIYTDCDTDAAPSLFGHILIASMLNIVLKEEHGIQQCQELIQEYMIRQAVNGKLQQTPAWHDYIKAPMFALEVEFLRAKSAEAGEDLNQGVAIFEEQSRQFLTQIQNQIRKECHN